MVALCTIQMFKLLNVLLYCMYHYCNVQQDNLGDLPRVHNTFYRAVMRLHVVGLSVCLSVCLSVTIRYRVQIGLNSWKVISRPNSLRPLLWLTPTWAIWCNGNTPKIRVE